MKITNIIAFEKDSIKIIKAPRAAPSIAPTSGINAPKPIKEGIAKEEAEELKAKIEEVGGVVEVK